MSRPRPRDPAGEAASSSGAVEHGGEGAAGMREKKEIQPERRRAPVARWSLDCARSPAVLARLEPAQDATADEGVVEHGGEGAAGMREKEEILACTGTAPGGLVRKRKGREIRGWRWAYCSQKLVSAPPAASRFPGIALRAPAVHLVKSGAKRACAGATGTFF